MAGSVVVLSTRRYKADGAELGCKSGRWLSYTGASFSRRIENGKELATLVTQSEMTSPMLCACL